MRYNFFSFHIETQIDLYLQRVPISHQYIMSHHVMSCHIVSYVISTENLTNTTMNERTNRKTLDQALTICPEGGQGTCT